MKRLVLLMVPLLMGSTAWGQSYDEIIAAYPDAVEAAPIADDVPVYAKPSSMAAVVAHLKQNETLLVFEKKGPFYAVADLEEGFLGYVAAKQLDFMDTFEQAVTPSHIQPGLAPAGGDSDAFIAIARAHSSLTAMRGKYNKTKVLRDAATYAPEVAVYSKKDTLFAYALHNDFYAIATRQKGHIGYVHKRLLISLDAGKEPTTEAGYKDPSFAQLWSLFVPGGGHIYSGENGAGVALLLTSLGATAAGYAVAAGSVEAECTSTGRGLNYTVNCTDNTNWTALYVGVGVSALAWVVGLADARPSAARMNRKHGATAPRLALYGRGRGAALAVRF